MALSKQLDESLSHRVPKAEALPRIEALRAGAKVFGEAIEANTKDERGPAGRQRALAITALEEALMRAVKSVVLE